MSYWLIAVPNEKPPKDALKTLQEGTRGLSSSYEFPVPPLKVGTLDSLMALSEELAKFDPILETLAKKIERTYFEISSQSEENSSSAPSSSSSSSSATAGRPQEQTLRMGDQTAKEYVEKFKWNDYRYNSRTALKGLTDTIIKESLKLDETLKKQLADYNETRSSFAQIERVETGTLLVRPLAAYVKEKDIIEGEFLTTLLVVVPKVKAEEFEATYAQLEVLKEKEIKENAERQAKERAEALGEGEEKEKEIILPRKSSTAEEKSKAEEKEKKEKSYKDGRTPDVEKLLSLRCPIAVPRSAKKLFDGSTSSSAEEFSLYRVVVLKKGADYYKSLLRDKRCTVRPFKYEPEEEQKKAEMKTELQKKKRAQWLYLQRWCNTSYVEAMVGWLHLKAIRLFVEGVLRYGLPVDFKCILIDPQRNEKRLRSSLKHLYGRLAGANQNLTAALDPNEVDPSGLGEDFYPYVYLPLNIAE